MFVLSVLLYVSGEFDVTSVTSSFTLHLARDIGGTQLVDKTNAFWWWRCSTNLCHGMQVSNPVRVIGFMYLAKIGCYDAMSIHWCITFILSMHM